LEAQATDPGTGGIDGGQAPTCGGEYGRIVADGGWVCHPRDELGPDGIDRLIEQDTDVATALLEAIEQDDAGRTVA
jgi:hypothetical protein